MSAPKMLDAALEYAARGWAVFPVWWPLADGTCACGNAKCGRNIGKHPIGKVAPHGFDSATKDPDTIRKWWARFPLANIGCATGDASGFDVVDIDVGESPEDADGRETVVRLEHEHGEVKTLTALSGSRGYHLYVIHREGVGSSKKPVPGVDVRGDGGYIILPPSLHKSGRRYDWLSGPTEPTPWPSWLHDYIVPKPPPPKPPPAASTAPAARASSTFEEAVRAYITAHVREYPPKHGTCPACGDDGCFGKLPESPDRWSCFSSDHEAKSDKCGLPGKGCWFGDALDLDAHAAGLSRAELLRRGGFLALVEGATSEPPAGPDSGGPSDPAGIREATRPSTMTARKTNTSLRRRPGARVVADTEPDADGRPVIRSGVRLDLTAEAAEQALADLLEPRVYTRARGLVTVRREGGKRLRGVKREEGAPFAHELAQEVVRGYLSKAAKWQTFDRRQEEWVPSLPPGPAVAMLCKQGSWSKIQPLVGIVESPTMRPDGTILCQPGYDTVTGLLYDPRGVAYPEVPNNPTPEDVNRAVAALREPFEQFEWEAPATDLAVVLALILTFAARPMFDGTSPCFAFDSTTRGSGKGLACEAATIAATGRRPPVSILSPEPEEQRKALFTLALEGHRAILLDNMTRPLGGGVLSAVLTSGSIRDRVLGGSRSAAAPFDAVLLATGNNLRFVGDFDRRVLVARQAPTVENPEDRQPPGGYRHPRLREYAMAEHPRLLAAALTVLRAFHVAGRPSHSRPVLGSFEAWDGIVRAACLWAEIGDPLACRERVRTESDDDRERIGALLTSWHEALGSAPATVAEAIQKSTMAPALRLAMAAFDGKGDPDRPNALSIGRGLRAVVRRIVGGLRLERASDKSPTPYRVVPVAGSPASTEPVGMVGLVGFDTADSNTPCARAGARVTEAAGENPTIPTNPAEMMEPGGSDGAGSEWWTRQGLDDRGEA